MFVCIAVADGHRWRRQADETPKKDDSLEVELCKDKDAGEWFRLVAGEGDNCRDVIQCTASVSIIGTTMHTFSRKYVLTVCLLHYYCQQRQEFELS